MVKVVVVSTLIAGVQAGSLAVTWTDCGATHAKVTSLKPSSVSTGKTETLVGTGTVDEDVTKAHFTAKVSAAGAKLAECSGDGTQDIQCKLPLGAGVITVKALTFPIKKGTVTIPVTVKTSSLIPASLAKVDVDIRATEQKGDTVICLNVHTKKAMEEEEVDCDCSCLPAEGKWQPIVDTFGPNCEEMCNPYVSHQKCDGRAVCCGKNDIKEVATHSCNSAEHTAIKKLSANEFGDKSNKCGKGAYNVLTGKFSHTKFNSCLTTSVGISTTCSECYAKTGEYGASNCKKDCLLGWCKQGCLTCTAPAQKDLPACTGMTNGTPQPCMDDITV